MATTNGTIGPATNNMDWLVGDITNPASARPNPEVVARPKRRRFTGEYKQRILTAVDAAKGTGEIGSLLRREGLYSSLVARWRRERDTAIRKGLQEQKRGPKPQADPRAVELQRLARENAALVEQLRKARIVIDVQKKVAAVLGRALPETESL
jgi:transposase